MSLLDTYLYYDEDQDIRPDEMTDSTVVEPLHILELYERGLLTSYEIFTHKGWHHQIHEWDDGFIDAEVWNGATAEEWVWSGNPDDNNWD